MSTLEVLGEKRTSDRNAEYSHPKFRQLLLLYKEKCLLDMKCVPAFAVFAGCRGWAMTDALVREAVSRGADVYTTGQLANRRAAETGTSSGGHRRCEEWGYRALAGVLSER